MKDKTTLDLADRIEAGEFDNVKFKNLTEEQFENIVRPDRPRGVREGERLRRQDHLPLWLAGLDAVVDFGVKLDLGIQLILTHSTLNL